MQEFKFHHPVLLNEVLEYLAIRPDGVYVDATFGRGGHAEAILNALGPTGQLLAIDKDPAAVAVATERFAKDKRFTIQQGSFTMLAQMIEQRGLTGKVAGILLDLGVSSPQLDEAARGFSFLRDGPLDMRMDPTSGISAADWLNTAKAEAIAEVLKTYGEERFAKRIANAIVHARNTKPLSTTGQLAEIVKAANPKWERDKHPATRSFQAIRIFINQELDDLTTCLTQVLNVLAPAGRLAVISFHSLEDRIVKRFIRDSERGPQLPKDIPIRVTEQPTRLCHIGHAIKPTEAEMAANPRARSAVLRIAEKVESTHAN